MDECELVTFVTAVACGISKCCSSDDLSILSAVFTQLGDTLATIIAKRDINQDVINSKANNNKENSSSNNNSNNKSINNNNNNNEKDNKCNKDEDS